MLYTAGWKQLIYGKFVDADKTYCDSGVLDQFRFLNGLIICGLFFVSLVGLLLIV